MNCLFCNYAMIKYGGMFVCHNCDYKLHIIICNNIIDYWCVTLTKKNEKFELESCKPYNYTRVFSLIENKHIVNVKLFIELNADKITEIFDNLLKLKIYE